MLENGTPYQLAYGVRLTLGRVGRNPVIQVHPGARAARLQTLGVRYERGVVPVYYIPNSDEGQQVLRRILDEFPVETGQGSGEAGFAALDFLLFGAQLIRDGVVKFAEWSRRMLARFGEVVRRDSVRLYYQAKAVARNIFSDERGSIGGQEMGPHAPIFREFYHDARGAIAKLRELETGEAVAALYHPEVGDIDLIWGRSGKNGYGLAKIVERHPEVVAQLQEILNGLKVSRRTEQTVFLEDPRHTALVRLNWMGREKKWLLTAYEKRQPPSAGRTIDVPGTRAADRQAPPPGGDTSIIVRKPEFENTSEHYSAVARGAELLRAGVTHFADWSRRMLAEFGQTITPYLRRLYLEAKRLWRDTSGQSEIEIRALTSLAEHAQRLARGVRTEVGARARRSAVAGGQG